MRRLLYLLIPLLYVLHNDFWWWDASFLVLNLPVGLSYHIVFCVVVALVMWLLVEKAWPEELVEEAEEPRP